MVSKTSKYPLLDAVVIDVEAKRSNDPDDDDFDTDDFDEDDPYQDEWYGEVVHEEFTGLPINVMFLQDYLSTAYVMYGHFFNPENYSPRLLYEALIGSDKYSVRVEGHNPDEDIEPELPPGAIP